MAQAAKVYLDVTFTKNLALKQGTLTDLKNRFAINNDSKLPQPSSIEILNAQILENKVRLEINSTMVPQPTNGVTVVYTSGIITGPPAVAENDGALVDSTTGYAVKDLVTVSSATTSSTVNPSRPTITNAVIEHETSNIVNLSFTAGRNIETGSTQNTNEANEDGGYGLVLFVTKSGGAYSNPSFAPNPNPTQKVWTSYLTPPSIYAQTLNITTTGGEFQKGMTVSVQARNEHIADQFDLSLNEQGEENYVDFPVTNNVKQINVDNAYISNIDPSAVIIYFKAGDISGVNMHSIDLNAVNSTRYKVFMDASGTNSLYDVSGVKDVSFNLQDCNARGIPSKYADISGIRFELQAFPFKYNNGGNGDIKIMYNLNSGEGDSERIRDGWGNECFNSGFDPKAVTSGTDLSCIPITSNMIKGITIKSTAGALDISGISGEDLSYNVILSFVTEDDGTDISGSFTSKVLTDYSFNNITTGKSFNPDNLYEISDPSRIVLYVDYSENSFDKMINKDDIVTLSYNPSGWPTSIKDEFGNYMLPKKDMSLVNSMELSGNILDTEGITLGADFKHIDLVYNVDLSLNSSGSMIMNPDGFTLNVDVPTGVNISEIKQDGIAENEVEIVLNKELYKGSNVTLSYSNNSSTIRSNYGFKLKNETNKVVDTTGIVAPGETFQWGYIQGKRNEFGIVDLSFNPPIELLGNGDGFKYAVGYSTMMSGPPYDLSTNGFIDISSIDVSLNDDKSIRLNTRYNDATDVRGFSRRSAEGGVYYTAIKYVGPDVSDNRPSGSTGYLEDFQFNIADASNSILDPSCNPDSSEKATAVIKEGEPNVVYIALQQPINEDGTINFYDISQINIFPSDAPKFVYDAVVAGGPGVGEYETTNITTATNLPLNGHTNYTKWIKATFDVDLSSNDLSLNYPFAGGVRDQNGGMLRSFSGLDISSNVQWIGLDGQGATFETGGTTDYPYISWENGSQNVVYIKWNPNFTDFDSTPLDSYRVKYTTGEGTDVILTPISQSWVNQSGVPGAEVSLRLVFNQSLVPANSVSPKFKYTKPIGVTQTGRWGGLKLGRNPKKWLRSFDYKDLNIEATPPAPTMTITATNPTGSTVADGASTSDPSLNLTFTSSISTSDFVAGDITVTNGTISNFSGSGTVYTAIFTPTGAGACTIDVAGGSFTSQGVDNTAATQFNWTKTELASLVIENIKWAFNNTQDNTERFLRVGIQFKDNNGVVNISNPDDVISAAGGGSGPNAITNQFDLSFNDFIQGYKIGSNTTTEKPDYAGTSSSEGGAIYDKVGSGGREGWVYLYWNLPSAPLMPDATALTVKYTRDSASANNLKSGVNFVSDFEQVDLDFLNYEIYDNTAPTMVITATNPTGTTVNSGDTTNDPSLNMIFTSSANTITFGQDDITVTNGTISNFSGSGQNYTATFTPTSSGGTTIIVGANRFYNSQGVINDVSSNEFQWTYTTGPLGQGGL